jgi:hypothetical protein
VVLGNVDQVTITSYQNVLIAILMSDAFEGRMAQNHLLALDTGWKFIFGLKHDPIYCIRSVFLKNAATICKQEKWQFEI